MVQKLTLEDEISQRRCRAQHTIDLICTLRKRVEQLVERYNQHTLSSSENSVKLLTLLLTELKENAEEAVASAAQNILESEGHLLPALCQDPGKLILSAIEQLRTSDLEDLVSENFSAQDYCSIHEVYRVIRRAVKNLKTQVALSPDEVMKHFTEGKSRYRIDHKLSLSLFLDNFLDKDLDQILEHSDSDTNFRKNMNKEYHNDLVIEKHLKRIIEPLLKKS